MRSPIFHSAVALVAASLTGAAFAAGDPDAQHDHNADAPAANQSAEVQVDTSTTNQPELGDGAIQAGAELDRQPDRVDLDAEGDVTIETDGDVNIKTDRDSLKRDADKATGASGEIRSNDQNRTTGTMQRDRDATGASGEIQTQTRDRSSETTTDTQLNTQQDRDGVGATGSVEIGDPDRSSRDATGAQGDLRVRDQERSTSQERSTYREGTMQRDDSAVGASGEIQTQQDRTYRTERYDRNRSTNGMGARGEVEIGGDAQPASARQSGDFDRSSSDDWKWTADKPHLHVDNPEKPHLAD